MSPEQLIEGQDWDSRIDIFNVGIVFYEMVVGVHPFYGGANTLADVNQKIMEMKYRIPHLNSLCAESFIRSTICYEKHRLFGLEAIKHVFIAPMVEDLVRSFDY